MALIVQKFGGTSVGSVERILCVAKWVLDTQALGHQVVVVVSAMSGETNRLIGLANQINPIPHSREYDLLVASGEQVAVGLLTLAINTEGRRRTREREMFAQGFLGHQVGIFTDSVYSKARIREINTQTLMKKIEQGVIPVIAGFQGVDSENNITTLGRGGSDTSAVALAVALNADDCEIYTDVDGVYTTDPRLSSDAKKISKIYYEEMMELASLGAKVLQIRSVELAAKYQLPLHVRSSFNPVSGTRVVGQMSDLGEVMEKVTVRGVAADAGQVQFTLQGLPFQLGAVSRVFQALSKAAIIVDIIVQDIPKRDEVFGLGFTVGKADYLRAKEVLHVLREEHFQSLEVYENLDLAKVSIVGVGMQNHPGVAAQMFALLAEAQVEIKMISTSEIKISCVIPESKMKLAVETLHRGFYLHQLD